MNSKYTTYSNYLE